eukprot:2719416-Rhodomonas_salina.6
MAKTQFHCKRARARVRTSVIMTACTESELIHSTLAGLGHTEQQWEPMEVMKGAGLHFRYIACAGSPHPSNPSSHLLCDFRS